MLNRRRQIADVFRPETWLRSRAAHLLSGLGLAVSPQIAGAARKSGRRTDDQERRNDDDKNNREDRDQKNQNERGSDQENGDKASAENRDSEEKSGKRDRNESRSENDESDDQGGSDNGTSRGESRRKDEDSDSRSREASSEDDSGEGGGRRVREFEQEAADPVADPAPPPAAPPTNPNVVIDDTPTSSIADLVVEANEDVIATVSASGGFAFARSGGVTAVTGPDGASIIQTGDVTTPAEPSDDGGNNDLDFAS